MKSIILHFASLKIIFKELVQGRYLLYFLPGIFISFVFYYLFSYSYLKTETITSTFKVVTDTIINQLYLFFILTILSPFNTSLSQKLDNQLTNSKYPSGILEIIRDFVRMIFLVLISIVLEFVVMGIWWILAYLFGLQFLNGILFFLISAFFFGFSFYDYSLERHSVGLFSSFSFSLKMPLNMILTGCIFLFISMIPIAGIILAPIISTMIATIVYLYSTKKIS